VKRVLQLRVKQLEADAELQMRADAPGEVVSGYAEDMRRGDVFPPVCALWDGERYWLWDGHQRRAAKLEAFGDKATIDVEVEDGTRRDAILLAAGANADKRALRRTNDDKRRAIETLLKDDEWGQWSDREIARRCSVSDKTVAIRREELLEQAAEDALLRNSALTRKFTRKGKTWRMRKSGRKAPSDHPLYAKLAERDAALGLALALSVEMGDDRTRKVLARGQEAAAAFRTRILEKAG
jgi:hypothetical protein